ncbi:MAG: undecaprenyl-diphosphate phosphatase [Eubacterium sp.]|nr:undecaprenyl-diphosphate phosphatase [Eubacterium sp.]
MSFFQAVLFGLVSAAAAALPFGSSALMMLMAHITGITGDVSLPLFTVFHIGILTAILAVYRKEIGKLILALIGAGGDLFFNINIFLFRRHIAGHEPYRDVFSGEDRKMAVSIFLTTLITSLMGLVLKGFSENASGNMLAAGGGLLITGLVLAVGSYMKQQNKKAAGLKLSDACLIGILQGISVIPGISRMGMVSAGACGAGFSRKLLADYSYLCAVPVIIGAILMENPLGQTSAFQDIEAIYLIVGIAISFIAGIYLVRLGRKVISKRTLRGFAVLDGVLGVLMIGLYLGMELYN